MLQFESDKLNFGIAKTFENSPETCTQRLVGRKEENNTHTNRKIKGKSERNAPIILILKTSFISVQATFV